jgi:hypothetical protein
MMRSRLPPNLHTLESLIPARDDLPRTEREAKWLLPNRSIKHSTVCELANIIDGDLVSCFRNIAGADLLVLNGEIDWLRVSDRSALRTR